MKRLLLGVLVLLSAAHAQEVETGLAAVRQRLRGHPVAQRKLSGLHHRAALMSGTLGETAAALERVEGPDASRQFAYLRERLLTASRSIETDFAWIEAKLAGLGLPEKLEAWHEFVRHYRGRLAVVDAELAALAANGSGLSPSELRQWLAALRAKFGSARAASVEASVKGPDLIAPIGRESVTYRSADDTPVPGDLAQSSVVLLSAEIRAKAAALDSNPLNLYNWVATQVEYVPYLGLMQNSLAVLQSGRGNAFDQSTLLIALLRASGIPARYVFADVAMSRADVRDWMGVKDETTLLGLLSTGLFRMFQLQGDRVIAGHVWVEAYLNSPSGKRWMGMDPARKRRKYQPGILLTQPPYDRMAYLKALKPVLPSEGYFDLLRADLQKRFSGRGFNEVPYIGAPLPPPPPTTDPPYSVVKLYFRASQAPTDFRHKIILTLSDYGGQTTYLNTGLNLPDVVLQSITLSYTPASAADRAVIDAFGGMEQVPAAVVNLIPEIRLQGQVVATGKTFLPMGATLDFAITHTAGAMDTRQYVNRNMCAAGETAAVVLGAHQVGEELLASRISSLLDRLPSAPAAETTRLLLNVAAIRYLHRLGMETQRLSDFLQVRFFQVAGVENAVTFASLEPQNLFDRPFVVTPGRLKIHANPTEAPLLDLNRSDQNGPVLRIAWQLHNDASSALEHEIWEELVMIPSVSTIKILQTAIRDNISLRTINRDNAATEMPNIVAAASTKAAMQQKINEGATLTAPQRPVTIGALKWQGWIEEFANWSFAYRIDAASLTGPAPGGDTGGTPPPPRPPAQEPGTTGQPGPVQNTTCSDPVNVANGNLFEQTTDYTLATQGPEILFQRTYSSLSLADGPLGPGWRHNYQVSLKDSAGSIVIQDGSGAVLNFRQVSGAWVSPPGYNLKLTKDAQGYLLRTKNGTESRFDPRGVLQSITDRNQNAIQLSYEGDRLRRVADRAGRAVTLSYDSKGRITTLEDFTGRRVAYEYDAAGHLAAATNAGGNRTVYAYYTDNIYKNLLKSFTTPEGGVTSFQFYGNGKAARVTLAGGQSMSFVYLPLRNETHVIDARGLLTSYQFNALGNVVRVLRPDGSAIDRVYSADAKLEAQTDAAGYTTRYTYDAAGNMTSVTDPLGRAMRFTYDPAFNLLTSIRDAGGNVTQFEYDARGNLTRSVQPLGVEARFTWDASGNVTSLTDPEGNTVTITYDELGNPATVRDALGNLTRREFDRLKRVTQGVDALGGEMRLEYDALDRVVRQLDQLGRASSVTYDRDGRLSNTTDPAGRTTAFRYDAMDHLAQVTDALSQVTQYAYATPDCGCAASANLSVHRDAAGLARSQTYDFLDRLVSTTDPLGNTALHGYDAQGNLARRTDANGKVTTFEYDPLGRLTGRAVSDASGARLAYDANNNLIGASNQHVTYTFTYDAMDRLKTFTDSRFNKTLTYDYDRLGRRTSLTDSEGGVFTYSWDANSRMASVQNPAGATAAFTYDALGRRTGLAYSSGAVSDYQYDAAGRLTSLVHGNPGAPAPLAGFAYGYDAAGNAVTLTDSSGTHQYQYDPLDRLVAAAHPALPAESYRYDGAGNRLASSSDPGYAYDAAGRLVAAEGASFLYDKNGNPIRKTTASGTTTYAWDIANQLVRIDLPDGGVATYKYDPLGRRIEKNVSGVVTAYLYDLSSPLLELDSAGAMQARYTHGPGIDQPLMMERGEQMYFYHLDGQANVAHLTDASGNTVCSYGYDSFGRTQPCQNVANPYGFAGREYDAESGLYYMRARYYDPSLGRFLSPDPLDLANLLLAAQDRRAGLALLPASSAALVGYAGMGALGSPQQLNPYSYALNNPAAFRDPSGLKCSVIVTMHPQHWHGSGHSPVSGRINDFYGWLDRNDYRLIYTADGDQAYIGDFAYIEDSSKKVVGRVDAVAAGFPIRPHRIPLEL